MDEGLLDSVTAITDISTRVRARDIEDPVMWIHGLAVVEAGSDLQGKGVVNSISMKDGNAFRQRAREVRRFYAAAVVMAFDEQGQADTLSRRLDICSACSDPS